MKVDELAAMAAAILMDTAKVRWTPAQHEVNMNAALRDVVDLRPDANTKTKTLSLAPGVTQQISSQGLYLVDVVCNLGLNGNIPGRSPRRIDLQTMTAARRDWRTDPAHGVVRNFMLNPGNPREFYVWPPQPDPAHHIQVLQPEYPPAVKLGASTDFPLPETFVNPVVHLSLSFGWQKAIGGDLNRSAFHRREAMQMLGLSGKSQQGETTAR